MTATASPQIQALFAEHDEPTHVDKQMVRDSVSPIVKLGYDAQRQILEYRSRLSDVEMSDHDEVTLGPVLEHMHQSLGAAEREAAAIVEHGRALAFAFTQLDLKLLAAKADVDRIVSATVDAVPAPGPAPLPVETANP